MSAIRSVVLGLALSLVSCTSTPRFSPLVALSGDDACTRCAGYLLPGASEPSPDAAYRIDSDLPEAFRSQGVLYSTRATLPAFHSADGSVVPLSMRQQRSSGFTTIDDDFEVFLYHLSFEGEEPRERRVVVYATNTGDAAVRVTPRSIMESRGTMARADGPESRLAVRMLADRWDASPAIEIPPGRGRVIALGPRLSLPEGGRPSGADASPSDFFNGWVRAKVEADGGAAPQLEVATIAIDAHTPPAEIAAACASLLTRGADSAEKNMDLSVPPPPCHVRRVAGVSAAFLWRSEVLTIDASDIPVDDGGLAFLMAAPAVQTVGCPEARQTGDMLLHPGYVHADTVGNYHVEYLVTVALANPSDRAVAVDFRFGKQDADIGLAWQIEVADEPVSREALRASPVRVQWAGAWREDDLPDNTRSLFHPARGAPGEPTAAAPIAIGPGQRVVVSLRFMPVGTSSLPFHLHLIRGG